MCMFIETQAFTQFSLDRIERAESDFDVLFFDESLKAKRNRSKFKISKEVTPFLEDRSYSITQTIAAVEPNAVSLKGGISYTGGRVFPTQLDNSLLIAPKVIKQLITQSDQQMMKSRTFELVQRARNVTNLVSWTYHVI